MQLTNNKAAIIAAVALNAAEVSGVSSAYCPQSGVCFRWGVPQAAATSTSGNLYFQLQAPVDFEWIGLGIGSQMRGSDMFVMYADGANNVTLSTRRGTGHSMPQYVQRRDVELLAGSGISNGQMTANVRCRECNLDLSGSGDWIAGWKPGKALESKNPSEPITKHQGYESFAVNLAQASMSSDTNPFLGPQSGGGEVVQGTGGASGGPDLGRTHGILMTIVFVGGYPVGSMLMPLVGNWIFHASWQMLAFIGMWAGFGIGYVIASRAGALFAGPHTSLGVVVCALMALQPVLGWLHHKHFVKHQSRGVISHVHIWYGRALMMLGIINGGLGLKMADNPARFVAGYSISAAVVSVLYLGSIFWGESRRARPRNKTNHPIMSDAVKLRSRENFV